jgi:TRAP-type C4-dicarboxylate transport system permease small subunit
VAWKWDNSELSDKYQTLVTPNSFAILIWAVILTFQGIFTISQLFPRFRGKKMVLAIAGVLAWATYSIYKELQEPRDQMVARFSMDLISGVSYAGVVVCVIILLQVVIRVPFDLYARCCKKTEETREQSPEKGGSVGSYLASNV